MTIDLILYDLDGAYCPPNLLAPVGGSEVELYQLHAAFNRAGLDCRLVTKRPTEHMGICRRFVYWRQVEPVPWADAGGTWVRATDAKPDGYRERFDLRTACVSNWQAKAYATPTVVVPPMLGEHVSKAPKTREPYAWVYASAANKGIRETLDSWAQSPRGSRLWVTTTGYDDPPRGLCEQYEAYGVRHLGRLSPRDLVVWLSDCQGLYYRNVAPETFGVTTAIAVKLGLELDVECVGHTECGLAESRVPQDLSEGTIVKRWLEILNL